MKVEFAVTQVYLQGECVQHRPQSSHDHQAKRKKRTEGQRGHAERAAFSSELAGLSFVYLGQDTPHCSKNKDQGWTVFIHSPALKSHEVSASACSLTCCKEGTSLSLPDHQSDLLVKTACSREIWVSRLVVYLILKLLFFRTISFCQSTAIPRLKTV